MKVPTLDDLTIKIFADGADEKALRQLAADPLIQGFTTNPTLMRQAGVDDYERFARNLLVDITDKPISFEVFSDDFDDMGRQARLIDSWGENVYVKVPITNTKGKSAAPLIKELLAEGIKINITAIFTIAQLDTIRPCFDDTSIGLISVFAGRIADSGVDPSRIMKYTVDLFKDSPKAETLWASCREVLNVFEASALGCDIITVTIPLLGKLSNVGTDHTAFSLDTVKMFYKDARASGYNL